MADLTRLPLVQLDELGILAAGGYDNVEIVETSIDHNAEHGINAEPEMSGKPFARFVAKVTQAKARLTTSALRRAWAPPCQGPWARVTLHGGATITVRPAIIDAVRALDACLRAIDYRATPPDCGAYNCRVITGGSNYSLHAYGIAIDINWQANPYGHRLITDMPPLLQASIKAIRTNSGVQVWGWGGDYSGNKDAMHDEIVCSPADIASGINPRTVPGAVAPSPGGFLMALSDAEQKLLLERTNQNNVLLTSINRILTGEGSTVQNPNGAAKGTMLGRIRDACARIESKLK